MSRVNEITVNVDEFLALDKYEVDEESAHIELVEDPDMEEFLKLVRVCPAALYKIDENGAKSFDYAGCLECGTCRIACGGTIVKKWENPPTHHGRGVPFRLGRRQGSGHPLSCLPAPRRLREGFSRVAAGNASRCPLVRALQWRLHRTQRKEPHP